MDHRDPFAPIALEAHTFGKGPKLFLLPIPTPDLDPAETLWMRLAQLRGHLSNPSPLVLPQNMPWTLHFTHPMFPLALNQPRQLKGEHAIIKGIVSLRELSFNEPK
jgi:hypothetical protein